MAEGLLVQAQQSASTRVQQQELAQCRTWLTSSHATAMQRMYAIMMLDGEGLGGGGHGNTGDTAALNAFIAQRHTHMSTETQKAIQAAVSSASGGLVTTMAGNHQSNAVPVLRLSVSGVIPRALRGNNDEHEDRGSTAVLKIWRPSEDVAGLSEGDVCVVAGLCANGTTDSGSGVRVLELQSTRFTR